MKQKIYLALGAITAYVLWRKGKNQEKADAALSEGANFANASDWQGNLWGRLNGALDLTVPDHPNVTASAQADPGRIGFAGTGLVAGWNGSLS